MDGQDAGSSSTEITKNLQQRCLDIFRDTLRPSSDDTDILQEVKAHLYNRDFAAAFGKDEYLRVYASRWSPSRALAYLQIFEGLTNDILPKESSTEGNDDGSVVNVVCLGGGAGGELVGLAGWLNASKKDSSSGRMQKLNVTLVDIADWTEVITALHDSIVTPPQLSQYASQAKKDVNKALVERDDIFVSFQQMDVLNSDEKDLSSLVAQADLVTLMFTLNELYSTSMPLTQHLLSSTLDFMRAGSHLLAVDSPGSYSTVSINGAEKKYPMQWLLNYILLGDPRKRDDGRNVKWEQLMSDDSRWFRLPEGLEYPIELEHMRYQIHLYRRRSDNGD